MFMNKKAQGVSINTIIIAAIALIVLVVLVMIFTGRMGIWGQGLDEATSGQACSEFESSSGASASWYDSTEGCPDTHRQVIGQISDSSSHQGQVCCVSRT